MIKKNIIFVIVFVMAIVLVVNFYVLSQHSCTTLQKIEATLTVKIIPGLGMLGLNADTDALRFGVVSPGIAAMRKIYIEHSEDAVVQVRMQGELASWTSISPETFNISQGESKEVIFEVSVPKYALPGNYTGAAVLCIQE